jgi:hypothetical protein
MIDETETLRLQRLVKINAERCSPTTLEARYGEIWNSEELSRGFTVRRFTAPYVVVVLNRDRQLGSVEFQHEPGLYFNFVPDRR